MTKRIMTTERVYTDGRRPARLNKKKTSKYQGDEKMKNAILFSSEKQDWETPKKLFDKLNDEFHFQTDVAASKENSKCSNYVDSEKDALSISWEDLGNIFCNPPYERTLQDAFIKKAYEESLKTNNKIVVLIPARTDTVRWHEHIFGKAEVRFLKGRVRFEENGIPRKHGATFPSALVIYN